MYVNTLNYLLIYISKKIPTVPKCFSGLYMIYNAKVFKVNKRILRLNLICRQCTFSDVLSDNTYTTYKALHAQPNAC